MNNTPTEKQTLLAEGIASGKNHIQAALDAGYAPSTAKSIISKLPTQQKLAPLLEKRRKELKEKAQIHTEEITGALVEIVEGDIADLFPHSKALRMAKRKGLSRIIKKVSIRYRKVGDRILPDGTKEPVIKEEIDLEVYSRLDAVSQLRDNFGMKQEPRSNTFEETRRQEVERAIEKISLAEGVDQPTAAKMLKEALGPDSPLSMTVNKYIH